MGLYLRGVDLARLDATMDVVLSPSRYADATAWCAAAGARLAELLGGDHCAVGVFRPGAFAGAAANMRDEVSEAQLQLLASCGSSSLRRLLGPPREAVRDPILARLEADRERAGAEVWSRVGAYVRAAAGTRRPGDLAYLGEVLARGRIRDSDNIDAALDGGYVVACVSYERPADARRGGFDRRAAPAVLRLLLPAVKAAARVWIGRARPGGTRPTPGAEEAAGRAAVGAPAGTPRPPRPGASALTAREWDVARLLAARATNREIAAALGLSPHTVRHHGEHVFAKLAVRSRRDVAARLRALDA
jgi:DNA-binding CsgD family transcriptional regulator